MPEEPDYYSILGVDPAVTHAELRQRHRQLVRELHPDKHASDPAFTERLTLINVAFHELRDPARRLSYDRRREGPDFFPRYAKRPAATAGGREYRPGGLRFKQPRQDFVRPVARRSSYKKNILVSAFVIGCSACIIATIFFALSNSSVGFAPIVPPNITTVVTSQPILSSTHVQMPTVQQEYMQRYYEADKDAQFTMHSVKETAAILDSEGNTAQAKALRESSVKISQNLALITDEMWSLTNGRSTAANQPDEESLDENLASLLSADERLRTQAESLKNSGDSGDSYMRSTSL